MTLTDPIVRKNYFWKNLALRPKFEVQSAHLSGKQYTKNKKQNNLHCAITEPFEINYHDHLCDDTKHNGVFVDHVLRDLIVNYNILNRACENKLITPHTRINILLDDFNHWLMSLT